MIYIAEPLKRLRTWQHGVFWEVRGERCLEREGLAGSVFKKQNLFCTLNTPGFVLSL